MKDEFIGIVAISKNGYIGKEGKLPWHLPEEIKLFKEITMGHTVVMGRKTYESIGKLLPGRKNIILTNNRNYKVEGATVIHRPDDIFFADTSSKIFIIGGKSVYEAFSPWITSWYVSKLTFDVDGDTKLDTKMLQLAEQQEHVYSGDDFTCTKYICNSAQITTFGREIFTNSLSPIEQRIIKYGNVEQAVKNPTFRDMVLERYRYYSKSHEIQLIRYKNGNIFFSALPKNIDKFKNNWANLNEQTLGYFEIIRPKHYLNYTDKEVKEAFDTIHAYIRNLFVCSEGEEELEMTKSLSYTIYEKMADTCLYQHNAPYKWDVAKSVCYYDCADWDDYREQFLFWYGKGEWSNKSLRDAIIDELIVPFFANMFSNYLDSIGGWEDWGFKGKPIKSLKVIKSRAYHSLHTIYTALYRALVLITKDVYVKLQDEDVIPKIIARLSEIDVLGKELAQEQH